MDAPQLTLKATDEDHVHVIAASGEIHLTTAPQLAQAVNAAVDDGHTRLVLDLSGVAFIDSTGLSVLLNLMRRLDALHGRLAIACANPTVLRLFEITRLEETFEIAATLDEAIARVQDGAADSTAGAP